jgi:hypothetical protein
LLKWLARTMPKKIYITVLVKSDPPARKTRFAQY